MRISELARITGNTPETIRYYERIGLLPPAACGVLMMLFVNLYRIPMLLGGIIVYTAIYCASVWLLSMNGYEKALVGGMVRKVLRK